MRTGQGDDRKCKAHSRTNFRPVPLLIGHGLYSWEHKYGRIYCYIILNMYLEDLIPQVVFFFFSNQAFMSVFGKICYFLSICTCDFYFVTEPVPMWIFQLLFLGRSKVIFSHQPTRHLIQLEHVAAFIQKTTFCLWQTLPCVTWVVKADWRGWLRSPARRLRCRQLKAVCA